MTPYNKIEKDREAQLSATMVAGNTLLKKWSADLLGTRKDRQFRHRLFKGEFKDQIPPSELMSILSVRSIQDEVFFGFTGVVNKVAHKWCRDKNHIEDYTQEASVSLIDAIYGYSSLKVKFITYAWTTIENRIKTYEVKKSGRTGITKSHRTLASNYNKIKEDANEHITFDEVVIRMNLTPVEVKILGETLVKVIKEVDINNSRSAFESYDLNMLEDKIVSVEHFCELGEVLEAIENAGLTTLERSVLEASMHSTVSHGWKKKFADNNINSKTGKPYTRQATQGILDRAHQKIKEYLKVA